MPREGLSERLRRSGMEEYLLADEKVLVCQRPHWAKLIKPVSIALAAFVVVLFLDTSLPSNAGGLVNLLWAAWLVLLGWTAFKVILYRRNWFVSTDKRMLVNYGLKLVNVNLAMLSLSKVVDLSYTRSTMGFLLGYGTIVRESSGSGQTLHDVEWVKHPDETYRTICAAVFNLHDRPLQVEEEWRGDQFEEGPPRHAPGLYADYVPVERGKGPVRARGAQDRGQDAIPGIRIEYGEPKGRSGRSWPSSPELSDSVRRDAATGPTRYRRSPTEDDWVPEPTDEDEEIGDQDVDQSDDDQGDDGDDGQG
jgi:hypothetical protein